MPYTAMALRDPKGVARLYVKRHRTYAQCRIEGHHWETVLQTPRARVKGLQEGITVIELCKRCATKAILQFDGLFRSVRTRRNVYPADWNEFSVKLVPRQCLRAEYYATLPSLAHSGAIS